MSNTSLKAIRIGSVICFILMIVVNALANILPINGKTTGELSDAYPNLFVPIGLTFSIWGVIYLFLFLYTLFQTWIIWKLSNGEKNTIQSIGMLYILSCIANAAWILLWHYELVFISVIVMLVLLITLVSIYLKTRGGKDTSFKEKLCVSSTFSLYLGWITVATIANITAWLVDIKWTGWGVSPQIWTAIVIVVAIIITVLFQIRFRDILYSAVVLWAFLGILIRHVTIFNSKYPVVIVTVGLGMVIIFVGMIIIARGCNSCKTLLKS